MVLLDALARARAGRCGIALSALHVHHGLSPQRRCLGGVLRAPSARARGVAARRQRASRVARARRRRASRPRARAARYARASPRLDVDAVALAHHADDQAETLLLQLLRGAGPHGLAAMPARARRRAGPALLRPLLALPRAALDAYARARGLGWVDDESNADTGIRRNYLRHDDRAAARRGVSRLSRDARCAPPRTRPRRRGSLDELAALDARGRASATTPVDGPTLDRARSIALAARRAAPRAQPAALVPAPPRPARAVDGAPRRDAATSSSRAAADARVRARARRASRSASTAGAIVVHAPRRSPAERARGRARPSSRCRTARLVFARGARSRASPRDALARRRSRVRRATAASGCASRPGPAAALLTDLLQRRRHAALAARRAAAACSAATTLAAVPGIGVDAARSRPATGSPASSSPGIPQPRQTLDRRQPATALGAA